MTGDSDSDSGRLLAGPRDAPARANAAAPVDPQLTHNARQQWHPGCLDFVCLCLCLPRVVRGRLSVETWPRLVFGPKRCKGGAAMQGGSRVGSGCGGSSKMPQGRHSIFVGSRSPLGFSNSGASGASESTLPVSATQDLGISLARGHGFRRSSPGALLCAVAGKFCPYAKI